MASAPVTALPKTLTKEIVAVAREATNFSVTNPKTYVEAWQFLYAVQRKRKDVEAHYKTLKDSVNSHRRVILDLEKEHLAPLFPAEAHLTEMITEYNQSTSVAVYVPQDEFSTQTKPRKVGVVTDLELLVRAVAEGRAPLDYLKPNNSAINSSVTQQGDLFDCDGVDVEEKVTLVTIEKNRDR